MGQRDDDNDCTNLPLKQWLEVMDEDQVPLHLDQLNHSHGHSHQPYLDDQAKFFPLILTSRHKVKNQHWNHHLKQLQHQENEQAWVIEYCKHESIDLLLAGDVGLASFLFDHGALIERNKPHLMKVENRSIPHPHWIHSQHRYPNYFWLWSCINNHVIVTQTKKVWKRSSETTWNWGLV